MPISIDTPDDLAEVFYGTVEKHASDRGYKFADPQPFHQLATHGSHVIFRRIKVGNVDPYHDNILRVIVQAEYDSKRFVDWMILNHRHRPGAQSGILEDVDFQASSSLNSPLYPFCHTGASSQVPATMGLADDLKAAEAGSDRGSENDC
ncbi:MAG: hypothetical protein ACLPT4_07880 [Verrucomicrobiia bacterium]